MLVLDDVGAGLEIRVVDRAHDVGLRQHEEVVVALEVVVVAGKARAAVVGLVEPVALDHRAHRAVQDQDALCRARRRVRRCGRVAWRAVGVANERRILASAPRVPPRRSDGGYIALTDRP